MGYTPVDFLRRASFVVLNKLNQVPILFRKTRFFYFTKCWPRHLGKGIKQIRVTNKMKLGTGSSFYSNVILEIGENAPLTIGRNFTISYGSIIVCNAGVQIGDYVMIGEYTSLRDTTHSSDKTELAFCKQTDISLPIILGNNVWIGRGCILLPGTVIGDNVIVGANSVVKGALESNSIYAGSPATKIKSL